MVSMLTSQTISSFSDELSKIAARKGVKMIGSLWSRAQEAFAAGDNVVGSQLMAKADELAKTPGVIKPSAAGSQLPKGFLGRGSEGPVTTVADPEFGLSARKLFDPEGMSGSELMRRKDVAGKALGNDPNVSKYHGQRPTPRGDGTMQFSEVIPRGPAPKVDIDPLLLKGKTRGQRRRIRENAVGSAYNKQIHQSPDYEAAKENIRKAYQKTPFTDPQDVRAANMVRDPRTGKLRAIDVIPAKPGEFADAEYKKVFEMPSNQFMTTPDVHPSLVKQPSGFAEGTGQLNNSLLDRKRIPGKIVSRKRSSNLFPGWTDIVNAGSRSTQPSLPSWKPQRPSSSPWGRHPVDAVRTNPGRQANRKRSAVSLPSW